MTQTPAIFDIAIVGGGINGCGVARDAAGRGFSVYLCEKGDLAGATSSASTKLIHGGLRYLEYYAFRLVREALREREVIWSIAPHIVWPLRFVLPHEAGMRPKWMLRLGLAMYDHIGGRKRLPPTLTLDLASDAAGQPLKRELRGIGFEYSDCWVDDSRLVALNARDAADRGALIRTRTAAIDAEPEAATWLLRTASRDGAPQVIRARVLINAAGPWVGEALKMATGRNPKALRLVKGAHIVVRTMFAHERCYFLQNDDGRVVFAIPYERDFTLIGTTDSDYAEDPAAVKASREDIAYLCRAANRYFTAQITPDDVVWSYAGVRALFDSGEGAAQEATRDYALDLDASAGPPLLTVYGGKITTYRRLAEQALETLHSFLGERAGRSRSWTGATPLPGGDFPLTGFDALVESLREEYPFLTAEEARRLARAYGTRVRRILGGARERAVLGRDFGAGLSEAEVRYLVDQEFACEANDILWRRSKLGLRLNPNEAAALGDFLKSTAIEPSIAAAEGGLEIR
ncbi:MAG: glycerol-3-phosphate dehydrogenase [Bradyrhizobium sp.]|nr:MAG: glycerol-3-phosphate dehydrogenase [Bradyrhizobium sp.]